METSDLQLIERWKDKDPELKKLWEAHLEMEDQLEEFNKRVYMSTEEQMQQKALKKKKLQGRTQIERILLNYRKKERDGA
jgi:uncharacterized protein